MVLRTERGFGRTLSPGVYSNRLPGPSKPGGFWTPRLTSKRLFTDTSSGVGPGREGQEPLFGVSIDSSLEDLPPTRRAGWAL